MEGDAKKKQDIWDSIGKLKLRDQLILLFGVIALGVFFAFLLFRLLIISGTNVKFHIPESTLRRTDGAQVHRQASFTDFPYTVVFPGTDYSTTVGGTEGVHTQYISSFSYSEDQLLILGVFNDTVPVNEFYSYALAGAIDQSINSADCKYESMVHDEGYLNAVPYIYEGGKLSAMGDYYLVSYIYHTDSGKMLLMMALTNKATQDAVNKSKSLADKMVYSMGRVVETAAEESTSNVAGGGSPESDKYALDRDVEENMTTKEKLEALDKKVTESAYAIEHPEAEDLEYYILVPSAMTEAIFYIDYTEVKSVPQLAYIKSPSGSKYAPSFNNGTGIGMVYWEISEPEVGNWLIHLSKNANYGQYFVGVLSRAEFEAVYGSRENPQPRNGQ